ncbi:MAG: response regulator transcription factor [Verrucomicrobiales bacterium]
MSEKNEDTPGKPTRVWVVEDNKTIRKIVAHVLTGQEDMVCAHQFGSCEDAIEALFAGERPDVILCNIVLSGMSGIEGIRRIKTALPEIFILVFSSWAADSEEVVSAICAGASGYIPKTSLTNEIPVVIREMLAGAHLNSQIARRVLDMFSELAPQGWDNGLTEQKKEMLDLMVEGLIISGKK